MFRQTFVVGPKIHKLWNVFMCRITFYAQNNPHQLLTHLLWFFQKTENILVKSSEIPKYGPKSKLNFFSKFFFSDFLLVQNVFWNFKIQCVKNWKLFIFKNFHKPHFTKWPYAKIRCKIYFFSFLKNHSRWVAGGDCFEHKKWFYT